MHRLKTQKVESDLNEIGILMFLTLVIFFVAIGIPTLINLEPSFGYEGIDFTPVTTYYQEAYAEQETINILTSYYFNPIPYSAFLVMPTSLENLPPPDSAMYFDLKYSQALVVEEGFVETDKPEMILVKESMLILQDGSFIPLSWKEIYYYIEKPEPVFEVKSAENMFMPPAYADSVYVLPIGENRIRNDIQDQSANCLSNALPAGGVQGGAGANVQFIGSAIASGFCHFTVYTINPNMPREIISDASVTALLMGGRQTVQDTNYDCGIARLTGVYTPHASIGEMSASETWHNATLPKVAWTTNFNSSLCRTTSPQFVGTNVGYPARQLGLDDFIDSFETNTHGDGSVVCDPTDETQCFYSLALIDGNVPIRQGSSKDASWDREYFKITLDPVSNKTTGHFQMKEHSNFPTGTMDDCKFERIGDKFNINSATENADVGQCVIFKSVFKNNVTGKSFTATVNATGSGSGTMRVFLDVMDGAMNMGNLYSGSTTSALTHTGDMSENLLRADLGTGQNHRLGIMEVNVPFSGTLQVDPEYSASSESEITVFVGFKDNSTDGSISLNITSIEIGDGDDFYDFDNSIVQFNEHLTNFANPSPIKKELDTGYVTTNRTQLTNSSAWEFADWVSFGEVNPCMAIITAGGNGQFGTVPADSFETDICGSSGASGTSLFFKVFKQSKYFGHNFTIFWNGTNTGLTGITPVFFQLRDGSFNRNDGNDFANSVNGHTRDHLPSKGGGGILGNTGQLSIGGTVTTARLSTTIVPDWSLSELPEVTLMVLINDFVGSMHGTLHIQNITSTNGAVWNFNTGDEYFLEGDGTCRTPSSAGECGLFRIDGALDFPLSVAPQLLPTPQSSVLSGTVTQVNSLELDWVHDGINTTGYRIYRTSTEDPDEILKFNTGILGSTNSIGIGSASNDPAFHIERFLSGSTIVWTGEIISKVRGAFNTGVAGNTQNGELRASIKSGDFFPTATNTANIANSTTSFRNSTISTLAVNPSFTQLTFNFVGDDLKNITSAQNVDFGVGFTWGEDGGASRIGQMSINEGDALTSGSGDSRYIFVGTPEWTPSGGRDLRMEIYTINQTKLQSIAIPFVNDTGSLDTNFTDTTTIGGNTYFYRVIPLNGDVEGNTIVILNGTQGINFNVTLSDFTAVVDSVGTTIPVESVCDTNIGEAFRVGCYTFDSADFVGIPTIYQNLGSLGFDGTARYFESEIASDFVSNATGIIGQAVLQNGTSSGQTNGEIYLGLTNSTWDFFHRPNTGSNLTSVNMWINGDVVGSAFYPILTNQPQSNGNGFQLGTDQGRLLLVLTQGGQLKFSLNVADFPIQPPDDGLWHMLSVSYDKGNVTRYLVCVDAVCEGQTPLSSGNPFTATSVTAIDFLTIGSDADHNTAGGVVENTFNVDDVTIWNGYELTQSDIDAMYNSGAGVTGRTIQPSLQVLHQSFDDVDFVAVPDVARNLGTLGSTVDATYFESDLQATFNVNVTGKIKESAIQEGIASLDDQGEIRFGDSLSTWNFLHAGNVGDNITSINFWINGDVIGAPVYPILGTVGADLSDDTGWALWTQSGTNMKITFRDSNVHQVAFLTIGTPPPDDGQFHMVTYIHNKGNTTGNFIVYCLDAVCVNGGVMSSPPLVATTNAMFNMTYGGGAGFGSAVTENTFQVDDLAIWNGYQLTQVDIDNLFALSASPSNVLSVNIADTVGASDGEALQITTAITDTVGALDGGGQDGANIALSNLVVYHRFDTDDISGSTSINRGTLGTVGDGTYTEAGIDSNIVLNASGIIGQAIIKNGTSSGNTDGELIIGNSLSTWNFLHAGNVGSNITSINFWINGDVVGQPVYPIFSTGGSDNIGDSTTPMFTLFTQGGTNMRYVIYEDDVTSGGFVDGGIIGSPPPDDGAWHMITWIMDQGNRTGNWVKYCLDTICSVDASMDSPFVDLTVGGIDASFNMTIGGGAPFGNSVTQNTFSFDDFAIWQGHQLTQAQINELYNGGVGKPVIGDSLLNVTLIPPPVFNVEITDTVSVEDDAVPTDKSVPIYTALIGLGFTTSFGGQIGQTSHYFGTDASGLFGTVDVTSISLLVGDTLALTQGNLSAVILSNVTSNVNNFEDLVIEGVSFATKATQQGFPAGSTDLRLMTNQLITWVFDPPVTITDTTGDTFYGFNYTNADTVNSFEIGTTDQFSIGNGCVIVNHTIGNVWQSCAFGVDNIQMEVMIELDSPVPSFTTNSGISPSNLIVYHTFDDEQQTATFDSTAGKVSSNAGTYGHDSTVVTSDFGQAIFTQPLPTGMFGESLLVKTLSQGFDYPLSSMNKMEEDWKFLTDDSSTREWGLSFWLNGNWSSATVGQFAPILNSISDGGAEVILDGVFGFALSVGDGQELHLDMFNDDDFIVLDLDSGLSFGDQIWSQIGITVDKDATTVILYVNGTNVGELNLVDFSGDISVPPEALLAIGSVIPAENWGFRTAVPLDFLIDDLCIWKDFLPSATNMSFLYNSGTGNTCSTVVSAGGGLNVTLISAPVPPTSAPANFILTLDNINSEIDLVWDAVPLATDYVVQRLSTERTIITTDNTSGDNNFASGSSFNRPTGDNANLAEGDIGVEVSLKSVRFATPRNEMIGGIWYNVTIGDPNGNRKPDSTSEVEFAGFMASAGSRLSRDCNGNNGFTSLVEQDGYTQRSDGTWFDGACLIEHRFLGNQLVNSTGQNNEIGAMWLNGSSGISLIKEAIGSGFTFGTTGDSPTGTWNILSGNNIELRVFKLNQTFVNVTTTTNTFFTDTTTNNYNSYFYRIIPKNTGGEGLDSIIVNGTLSVRPQRVPDLNGTDNGATVDLVWAEAPIKFSRALSEDPVQGYLIQRALSNETTVYDGLAFDTEEFFWKSVDSIVTLVQGQGSGTGGAPSFGSNIANGGQILNITQATNITRMVVKIGVSNGQSFNTEPDLAGGIWFGNGTAITRSIMPRVANFADMFTWSTDKDDHEGFVNWAFSPPVSLVAGEYIFGWSSLNAQTCVSASCGLGNADVGDYEVFFEFTNNGDADGYGVVGNGAQFPPTASSQPINNTKTTDYAMAIFAEPVWTTIGTNLGVSNTTFTDSSPPINVTKAYRVLAFNDAGISHPPTLLHNPQGVFLRQMTNTTDFFLVDVNNEVMGLNVGEVLTFEFVPPAIFNVTITETVGVSDGEIDGANIALSNLIVYHRFDTQDKFNNGLSTLNLGTLGSEADAQYFIPDTNVTATAIVTNTTGLINESIFQDGESTLGDRAEIRIGNFANRDQWNFLTNGTDGFNVTSINFWLNGDIVGSPEYPILDTFDSGASSNRFSLITKSGNMEVRMRENSQTKLSDNVGIISAPPDDGQWHMITILMDKGNFTNFVKVCIDGSTNCGTRDLTNAFVGDGGDQDRQLSIGSRQGGSLTENAFNIDDFAIWQGHQLTNEQIDELFNNGTGKPVIGVSLLNVTLISANLPDQVTGLTITQNMNNNATLDWNDALNADNYQVLRLNNFSSGVDVNANSTWYFREGGSLSGIELDPICNISVTTGSDGHFELFGLDGNDRRPECYMMKTFPRDFLNNSRIQLNFVLTHTGSPADVFGDTFVNTQDDPNQIQRDDDSEWSANSPHFLRRTQGFTAGASDVVSLIDSQSLTKQLATFVRATVDLVDLQSDWNTPDTDYSSIIFQVRDENPSGGQSIKLRVFWINITDFTTGAPKAFYNFSGGVKTNDPFNFNLLGCSSPDECERGSINSGSFILTNENFEVVGTPITSDFEDSTIPLQGVSTYKVRGNNTDGFGLNSTEVDFGLIQPIQNLNATALNSTAIKLTWDQVSTEHPTDVLTGVIIQRSLIADLKLNFAFDNNGGIGKTNIGSGSELTNSEHCGVGTCNYELPPANLGTTQIGFEFSGIVDNSTRWGVSGSAGSAHNTTNVSDWDFLNTQDWSIGWWMLRDTPSGFSTFLTTINDAGDGSGTVGVSNFDDRDGLTIVFDDNNQQVQVFTMDGNFTNGLNETSSTLFLEEDNAFHHYFITHDRGNEVKWYKDGILIQTDSSILTSTGKADIGLKVGNCWNPSFCIKNDETTFSGGTIDFPTKVDQLLIFNRVVGSSEVSTIFNSGSGIKIGFNTIATVDDLDTMFTDIGLAENTTYTYRLKGQSAVSTGAFGENNTATTLLAPTPPDQVTGLVITQEMNNNATLNWNDALGADNYQVLRLENFSSGFEVNVNSTWQYREQQTNVQAVFAPLCGFADIGTDANGFIEMSGDSGFSNRSGECYIFKNFPRAFLNGSQIQLNYDFSNLQASNIAITTVDTRNEPNQLQRNDESEWAESSARNFLNTDVDVVNIKGLILNGGRQTVNLIDSLPEWNKVDTDYASIIIETSDTSILGQDGTVKIFWINITDFTTGAPRVFYNFSAGTEVGEPEICAEGQDCRRGTFGAGTTIITDQIFEVIGTPITSDFEDSTIPLQGVSTYKVRGNNTDGFGLNSTEVDFGLIQQIQNLNATGLNSTAVKLTWVQASTEHPTDPLTGIIIQRSIGTQPTPDFFDDFTTDKGWSSNRTDGSIDIYTATGTINVTKLVTNVPPLHSARISLNIDDLLTGGWDQSKWTLRGKVQMNQTKTVTGFLLLGVSEVNQQNMSGSLNALSCGAGTLRDTGCLSFGAGNIKFWQWLTKNDTDTANTNLNLTEPYVLDSFIYPEIIVDEPNIRLTVYSDANYQNVIGCTNDKFDSSTGNCDFESGNINDGVTSGAILIDGTAFQATRWSNLNFLMFGASATGVLGNPSTQGSIHEVSFFNNVNMTEFDSGFVTVATVDDLDTMFTDTGLVVNTDYIYRVKGQSAVSTGSFSENNTATTFSALNATQTETDFVVVADQTVLISPPFPITTLVGSTVGNACNLSWSAPPDGGSAITKFQIFRSVDGSVYTLLLNKTITSHTDSGLVNNILYEYNVTALNAFGDSEPSNIVDCMPVVNDVPSTPSPLIAFEEPSGDVTLTWVEPLNGDPTGYQIQRKIENGGFLILVNDTATPALTFLDTATDPSVEYTWRVAGWNSLGLGAFTVPVTLRMNSPASAPILSGAQNGDQIDLSWTVPASDNPITGYKIDRRINFGALSVLVANTTTTLTTFTDLNVTKPDVFGYRVRALSSSGEGTVSNVVDIVFGSHLIVHVREQDGSFFSGGGIVKGENSTFSLLVGLDVNSDSIFDNLAVGNFNFTFFDDDNFILNKTFNFPAPAGNDTSEFTINALVFDVDCPANGSGSDIRIKVNYTDAKDITEFPSLPVCDSTDQVSWSTRWQGDAVNDTSTMIADFISTVFKTNAEQFLASADIIPTIYNSGENQIESETYVVNMTDVTINFNLFLDRAPSGGGGGGGGKDVGDTPTISIPDPEVVFEQRLTGLSILSRTHQFAQAGDVIEGSITVNWEGEINLDVRAIDTSRTDLDIRFDLAPFPLDQRIVGIGEFAMSTADIPYIIVLPADECNPEIGLTQNCFDPILHTIPLEFEFERDGQVYEASTEVFVDGRPIPLDIVQLQIILLFMVLIASAVFGRFIRNRARGSTRRTKTKKKKFKKKFDSS